MRSGVIRLTGVIESLERRKLFRRLHLQNRQNADEINGVGDNLGVESESQANQRNQVLFATTGLKRKAASSEQTISSLFMCLLSDQVIALWTSRVPGVAFEDKYFVTTGR